MSWDILIQDLPDAPSLDDVPQDFTPGDIGTRSEVIAHIVGVAPQADFNDLSWGLIEGEGWSIEANLGDDEPCTSLMLHVRGGEAALPVVIAIVERLGRRAIDLQTSEFFDPTPAVRSFAQWREYRDGVVDEYREPATDEELPGGQKRRGLFARFFG